MEYLAKLVEMADANDLRLRSPQHSQGTPEVLFDAVQLPLVALTTLACLSLPGRQSFPVSEAGLRVGAALMSAFPPFVRVGRRLQWSLRVRTVSAQAIVLLEELGLAEVELRKAGRSVSATKLGRDFIKKAVRTEHTKELMNTLRTAARMTRSEKLRLL